MSGAPTGLTLSPTTSSGVKSMRKLLRRLVPVSVRIPFSTISRTTLPSTASPASAFGLVTLTTRPGNGPGSACGPRGTFMNSSMLVVTSGALSCPAADGTPSTRRPPSNAAPAPAARSSSRRSKLRLSVRVE